MPEVMYSDDPYADAADDVLEDFSAEDAAAEAEATRTTKRAAPAAPAPAPRETASAVAKRLREETEQSLLEYLQSLSGTNPIRVELVRRMPKTWEGRNIEGTIDTFDEPLSEEDIMDSYGGGKYEVRVRIPNAKGQYVYGGQRTIKISGDPKVAAGGTVLSTQQQEPGGIAGQALKMTQQLALSAEERARRAEERAEARSREVPRSDPSIGILSQQMAEMQRLLAHKDQQLLELVRESRDRKPETGTADMILSKMLDGESSRVTAIRTQVESEIRTMQSRHDAELDRIHQRSDDLLRRSEDAHVRELSTVRASFEAQITTLKIAYEGQIEGFKREISHLDRELTAAKAECAELRSRKERGPTETLTEMAALKDAMEAFSGGHEKDPEEKQSTLERLLGAAGPLIEGVAARVASPGPAAMAAMQAAGPPQQQDPFADMPVGQPFKLPDGRTILKRSDGSVVQLRAKVKPSVTAPSGEEIQFDPADVAMAVQFMENALAAGTDPKEFADSARMLVPESVRAVLRTKGVDYFLSDVAKLEGTSPLLQQRGRNWARKVADELIGK